MGMAVGVARIASIAEASGISRAIAQSHARAKARTATICSATTAKASATCHAIAPKPGPRAKAGEGTSSTTEHEACFCRGAPHVQQQQLQQLIDVAGIAVAITAAVAVRVVILSRGCSKFLRQRIAA